MEIHAHVPKLGKTLPHWLLEGLFIVISVALGFGVAQFRESRQNHELAARVLKDLQAEVEHNLAALESQVALHRRWLGALNTWLETQSKSRTPNSEETAKDVFIATWPDFNPRDIKPPFPFLRHTAWDTALSTGALKLIDYDVAANLSEIYQWQQALAAAVEKLPYFSTPFFDPAGRNASVRQLAFQLDAIGMTEGFLLTAYRQHLPVIRAAAADR